MTTPVNSSPLHCLALDCCRASILADLLDPGAPFVWISGHNPHPTFEWFSASVPLSDKYQGEGVEVRSLFFDLLMPTSRFLTLLPHFDSFGIELCQLNRRVPKTLQMPKREDKNRIRILLQNGLVCDFFLPHAGEVATFAAVDEKLIDRALTRPRVQELLISRTGPGRPWGTA